MIMNLKSALVKRNGWHSGDDDNEVWYDKSVGQRIRN